MTHELLQQALDALEYHTAQTRPIHNTELAIETLRAELEKPEHNPMTEVADRFAHKLALDLECVLADYSGYWYDTAMKTLGEYRSAMNAIHEQECPTFMGEPVEGSLTPSSYLDGMARCNNCNREAIGVVSAV